MIDTSEARLRGGEFRYSRSTVRVRMIGLMDDIYLVVPRR